MQVVTIGSLLESAISCSSSSMFLSQSSSTQSEISPGCNHSVLASEALQKVLGKRSRDKQGEQGMSSKKVGAKCQTRNVLPQCWVIIGRLQLCNRNVHYWNGLYVPADCVALTDSTATICCCVCQGPDPRFLGKLVRVNSWSFIPRKGPPLTRVPPSLALNAECQLGILEVHSLEVVEGQNAEESILPPLFVSSAADGGKAPHEILLTHQKRHGRELSVRGIPHSISPPFILPCKYSEDHRKSPSRAGSRRMQDREAGSNGKFAREPTLGFFVEIRFCSACRQSCFETWTNSVEQEIHVSGKLDESGNKTVPPRPSPGVGLKTLQSTTTERNSTAENHSSSSGPPEAARALCSKTRTEPEGSLLRVYYSGSVSAWRPVLSGVMGRCITITGLRKKLIVVGSDKKPHIILLATRKSLITLECGIEALGGDLKTSRFEELKRRSDPTNARGGKFRPREKECKDKKFKRDIEIGNSFDWLCADERGKNPLPGCHGEHVCVEEGRVKSVDMDNRVISFVGIVTDSLFQGTLLELDERIWLLLTHQRHTKLYGLRIGALLSLREVHSITIKDLTGKILVLGACMHSHVSVVQYSPLLTQTSLQVHSKSLLLKHIQFLSFTSTVWLLSLIGSFRLKFRDIFSNKELLGAKKDPGIIQKYAQRMIGPDETVERDVVKEFFQKRFCRLGDSLPSTSIMKVPPIANFIEHMQALWQNSRSLDFSSTSELSGQLTISSRELGIILLGSLQVCATSGELHLSDATGMVNVVVPDLLSSERLSRTYQVSRFTVMLEGLDRASPSGTIAIGASSISWSSLLKELNVAPKSELLKYSVCFLMRDATHLHELDWCENFTRQTGPLLHRLQGKSWSQMQDKWTETKSHLDFLRRWFRTQTPDVQRVSCSDHGLGILSELVGESVRSDHLLKVTCKVMAVRLLVFEWPGDPMTSEERNIESPSWLGVKCCATSGRSAFGIPLTLACFVVDDGSGLVDCWARGDAAVSLLGLTKLTDQLKLPDATLEKIWTDLAVESGAHPFKGLSLEQVLCRMTQRYGQMVLQKSESYGDSMSPQYLMNGSGGEFLNDDEQSLMHLVLTSVCLNGPVVVVAKNIPSMEKICSADSEKGSGFCRVLACCSPRYVRDPSLGRSKVQLLAHRVDTGVCLTDLKTMIDQVDGMLQN